MHAETHVTVLPGDLKGTQQADEIRIGSFIEDDDAGIDGQLCTICRDIDRVRVATAVIVGLENGYLVVTVQQVGRDHT